MSSHIRVYTYPFQLTKADVLLDGPVAAPNQPFTLDSNTMLIWVDLLPEARFAHPTAYVLISASHVRVEKCSWWPVLNGRRILYGENPIAIPSPFEVGVQAADVEAALKLLGDADLPHGNSPHSAYVAPTDPRPVFTVDHVELAVIKTNPPKLLISCLGTTRTAGWRNPRLQPRIYCQSPADGLWEFDFVADPPSGIVLPVITHVTATYLYEGDFSLWKGVRVIAETNRREKHFGDPKASSDSGHLVIERTT